MAGTYTLTVTDTANCVESQDIQIEVSPGPPLAFSAYDTLFVSPGYLLDAGQEAAATYLWNTGDTTAAITIDSMGLYRVQALSPEGCQSLDSVQILFGGIPFFVPNAFTPNGDGLNDRFGVIPRYDYIDRFNLSIYNRWGQRIFETSGINQKWDGTYQNQPCQSGVYVYRIVYQELGNQPQQTKIKEGTVMLVR